MAARRTADGPLWIPVRVTNSAVGRLECEPRTRGSGEIGAAHEAERQGQTRRKPGTQSHEATAVHWGTVMLVGLPNFLLGEAVLMFGRKMLPLPLCAVAIVSACSDLATAPDDALHVTTRLTSARGGVVSPKAFGDSVYTVNDTVPLTSNGVALSDMRRKRRARTWLRVQVVDTLVGRLTPDGNAVVAMRPGRTRIVLQVNGVTDTLAFNVGDRVADVSSLPAPFEPEPPVPTVPGSPDVVNNSPPEAPRDSVRLNEPTVTGRSIAVRTSAEFTTALASARGGDEIVLADRAVIVGNFTLPRRADNGVVVVRSATSTPAGRRVTPAMAASFAKILTPNVMAALEAAPGSQGWFIKNVEFSLSDQAPFAYNIISLGHGEATLAEQPSRIILDRVYVHSTATLRVQRCVGLQGREQAVINSWLSECHSRGEDSQAIAGWLGAGPYHIENNYLEGSGQNIMFGGGDPVVRGLVPSDIIIRRNHMHKPIAWANGRWLVKNIFQLKSARRLVFESNILENSWVDGQIGFAIVMYSANQDGNSAGSAVQDILLRNNIVRNATNGINIAATSANAVNPSSRTARIRVENNLFENIGDPVTGAPGKFVQFLDQHSDVTFLRNSFIGKNVAQFAILFDGAPSRRLVMARNLFSSTTYGLFGSGTGEGARTLTQFSPDADVSSNAFTGREGGNYPTGNVFPTVLPPGSYSFETNNGSIGADRTRLLAATAGVMADR
jgi:hypothetical protein